MPKFGNNIETVITVSPQWGDLFVIASRKRGTKKWVKYISALPIFYYICINDLQGNQVKASAVSTITKSLPIEFASFVNYSLLATLGYINLFMEKKERY